MASGTSVEQLIPAGLLVGIKFDLMSGDDIEKFSDVNIVETSDLTNSKLGLPNALSNCATCGSTNVRDCDGHYGLIKLPATIYHPYLVSEIVQILNSVCPGCKSIKQDLRMKGCSTPEIEGFIGGDTFALKALCKSLSVTKRRLLLKFLKSMKFQENYLKCKKKRAPTDKQSGCKYCSRSSTQWYPAVKFKISSEDIQGKRSIAIVAEITNKVPKKYQNTNLSELFPDDYWNFISRYPHQKEPNTKRIILSPSQAFGILKQLDKGFIEKFVSRRDLLFLSCLPITPNCHRVMETFHVYADGPQLSFDERTKAYKRVVDIPRKFVEFRKHEQFGSLAPSFTASRVTDSINVSKLRSSRSSVGDRPSRSSGMKTSYGLKWLKDVVLSKRSDNGFRMVMVGDPKIKLGEIGVPYDIAENLYVAEHVNAHNLETLNLSCNLHLLRKEQLHANIKGKLSSVCKSNQLQVGDIFYRPLRNGDIVLINRPPSVHQHSLIAMSVNILPIQSVISINPLCCAPILGDFDGDCLHGYVPQSYRARVELRELVSLENQLLNAQDGRGLLSLTNDSQTAAHLLTTTGVFFNKFEMQQLGMYSSCELPSPAIVISSKGRYPLWTGQQVLSMLLPPSMDFSIGTGKILVSKGEILSSPGISFWLQNTTGGIFSNMFRCYGRKALDFLFSAQNVLCEYLTMRGLSVTLADIYLSSDANSRIKLIDEVSCGLQEAKDAFRTKQLMLDPELEFLLKSYDDEDSSQSMKPSFKKKRTNARQVSIASFKDVFHDLQNAILQYISKDNSMLTMIRAGSKGSLLKLVQQGACLGLQFSASQLPFPMPQKLSCGTWNQQKDLNQCEMPQNAIEYTACRDFYAVITSSFLDGLNPLECFVHALSGRSNLFSENAEVPGTLTRKLMFYMRDLYVGYDGTVRNVCGQQLVQLSYNLPDETPIEAKESFEVYDENDAESKGLGGNPVGSWAACSISEAAYGAVDQPMSSLEASPLMRLKNVFECTRPKNSVDQTISLYLSKKLERWNYGSEYGALEVKNHLERVVFSDVVTTVMIVYGGCEIEGVKLCPWISHFHVSKERMLKKKLNVEHIKDELLSSYDSTRPKIGRLLPKMCTLCRDCSFAAMEKEYDDTFCITVLFETSESHELLDTIRDMLIPLLLQTRIKGFEEFKKVDILCDTQPDCQSRLFLRVNLTGKCMPGKMWSILQNACIPIMDLIDWQYSHPDNIYDIYTTYGIDVAWRYFLQSLKSATLDIGRTIHREHLLMVADCLFMTGEFHGLSAKGLERQRDYASSSSPFSQACFSNPCKFFINAAKQGSTDNLCGAVDAMAWGKEAPIGTGGPFEIIYSGKVHDPKKSDSIYNILQSIKHDKPCQNLIGVSRPSCQNTSGKWKRRPMVANAHHGTGGLDKYQASGVNYIETVDSSKNLVGKLERRIEGQILLSPSGFIPQKKHRKFGFKPESDLRNIGSMVVDMCSSLRSILHLYPINEYLNEADKSVVMDALIYHPKGDAKRGTGIQEIKIGHNPKHPGSRCFILIRLDGSMEDFSYRKCVAGAAKQISPEFGLMIEKELLGMQTGSRH